VAVKLLHDPGERARRRFRREVLACARLRHPHLVPLFDSGEDALGRPFLVMELVRDGRPLDAVARGDPRRAAALVRDAARAVDYAHGEGVLHRDLKPGKS